jgi:hypothetical protein
MHRTRIVTTFLIVMTFLSGAAAQSLDPQLEQGRKAIEGRAGCFLVDYSFVETQPLKPGYTKDNRVYDVNKDKSVKEWIFAENISPTRIWLQHVLMATDLSGKLMEGTVLKHMAEDWQYNAPFLYDYAGSSTWNVKSLKSTPNLWTRRITNLDDGLRYQCAAAWKTTTAYPEWNCDDDAPIPGRETRDMQRKDYNFLGRSTRIIVYDDNWLERESNTKIIDDSGTKTPLAKELGKTWYVRLPDSECSAAQDFVKPRLAFWKIVRESWDQVLTGNNTFVELPAPKDQPSRYEQLLNLEDEYIAKDLSNPAVASEARTAILKAIASSKKE